MIQFRRSVFKLFTLFVLWLSFQACKTSYEAADAQNMETSGPENGTLVIVGGGRANDIFMKFVELSGGKDAPIVIIPTAGGSPQLDDPGYLESMKSRYTEMGLTNLSILHTNDPNRANEADFVAPIKEAAALWFTGGRQWRLVDSYANTATLEAIKELLDRGGVVGGSSAGATIQGSYLARGDTKSNLIMMGDHEEGFGFLTNSAIDQHLLKRNRQFDLFEILDKQPHLLGIGLDESTAIIVKGTEFEVIGKSYVAIYDRSMWQRDKGKPYQLKNGAKQFYLLSEGMKYDLKKREVIRD